jgi:hypothetical protein
LFSDPNNFSARKFLAVRDHDYLYLEFPGQRLDQFPDDPRVVAAEVLERLIEDE